VQLCPEQLGEQQQSGPACAGLVERFNPTVPSARRRAVLLA